MDATIATLVIGGLFAATAVAAIVFMLMRGDGARGELGRSLADFLRLSEQLAVQQAELSGRVQQIQSDVNERLEALSKRMGDGMVLQTEKTGATLKELHARLAVIDAAQQKITDLSQKVVGLQDILSNKQARGAFGEIQLNDLVADVLPPSAYAFQAPLSNGKRADCLLKLPNPPGPIVIDSKFPLESYEALRNAKTDGEIVGARRAFAAAVTKHVQDIAERYIVPGETADSALMFLPSEAVYAELHASLREVVQKSFRAKVWIVSPTTMMATLITVRAIFRDVHMREQAGLIQQEVEKMLEDVSRLDDRTEKLQRHMEQASDDLRQIRISTEKIVGRGEKIGEVQLAEEAASEALAPVPEATRLEKLAG